jgi:hypothetical protein
MSALHDADAAIGVSNPFALAVERNAQEAVRPLPDIAGEVIQSVAVGAEGPAALGGNRGRPGAGGFGLVAGDPGLRRIGGVDERQRFVTGLLSRRECPLLVGRQAIADARFA